MPHPFEHLRKGGTAQIPLDRIRAAAAPAPIGIGGPSIVYIREQEVLILE